MMTLRTSFFRYDEDNPCGFVAAQTSAHPSTHSTRDGADQHPVEAAQERLAVQRPGGERLRTRADRRRPGGRRDVGHCTSPLRSPNRKPAGSPRALVEVEGDDGGLLGVPEPDEPLPGDWRSCLTLGPAAIRPTLGSLVGGTPFGNSAV